MEEAKPNGRGERERERNVDGCKQALWFAGAGWRKSGNLTMEAMGVQGRGWR